MVQPDPVAAAKLDFPVIYTSAIHGTATLAHQRNFRINVSVALDGHHGSAHEVGRNVIITVRIFPAGHVGRQSDRVSDFMDDRA